MGLGDSRIEYLEIKLIQLVENKKSPTNIQTIIFNRIIETQTNIHKNSLIKSTLKHQLL